MDTEDTIRKLVEEAIEQGYRGPAEIAAAIAPMLDGMMEEDLLDYGLRHFVGDTLRRNRRPTRRTPSGSQPYERVREVIQTGRWQVETPDGWKQLKECDSDDLAFVRDAHHELARRNTEAAHRYEALRQKLIAERKRVVGELDEDAVIDIMGNGDTQ